MWKSEQIYLQNCSLEERQKSIETMFLKLLQNITQIKAAIKFFNNLLRGDNASLRSTMCDASSFAHFIYMQNTYSSTEHITT